jgi:pimeloyl-ACP methyl ester carboxylesterase
MYRDLIPLLTDRFHVIAPDYIGFGQSDAPSVADFRYTFDSLTDHVAGLIDQLGLTSYVLYMQDYGGPVGFRLFTRRPERVKGFVIQNANAYLEGVGDMPKQIFLPLWTKRDATTEAAARGFLAAETTRFQYEVGAKNVGQPRQLDDRPGPARSPGHGRLPARPARGLQDQCRALRRLARRVPRAPAHDPDRLGQERPVLHSRRRRSVQAGPAAGPSGLARRRPLRPRRERRARRRRDQGRLRALNPPRKRPRGHRRRAGRQAHTPVSSRRTPCRRPF